MPRAVLLLGERKQGVTRTIWARNQVFDGECSGLGYGGVRQGPVTEHFAVPTCYKHSKTCTGSVTDPSEVPNARSQSSEIGAHAARDGHRLRQVAVLGQLEAEHGEAGHRREEREAFGRAWV